MEEAGEVNLAMAPLFRGEEEREESSGEEEREGQVRTRGKVR